MSHYPRHKGKTTGEGVRSRIKRTVKALRKKAVATRKERHEQDRRRKSLWP